MAEFIHFEAEHSDSESENDENISDMNSFINDEIDEMKMKIMPLQMFKLT